MPKNEWEEITSDGLLHTVIRYTNGKIRTEYWQIAGETSLIFHRDDGPAFIKYYKNGMVAVEEYYNHGELYRHTDDPVRVEYFEMGVVKHMKFNRKVDDSPYPSDIAYTCDGFLMWAGWKDKDLHNHREGNPAIIMYNVDYGIDSVRWYNHGYLHREDGPAIDDFFYGDSEKSIRYYWYGHNITEIVKGLFGGIPKQLTKEQQILLKLSIPTEYL